MIEEQKQEGGGSSPWKIHSQETLQQHLACIRLSRLHSPELSRYCYPLAGGLGGVWCWWGGAQKDPKADQRQ